MMRGTTEDTEHTDERDYRGNGSRVDSLEKRSGKAMGTTEDTDERDFRGGGSRADGLEKRSGKAMGTTEDTEDTEHGNARTRESTRPTLIHGELTGRIRQTAFEVHEYFGSGFLERVYENSLAHRLRKQGHNVINQAPLVVRDQDETVVGEYVADLLVDGLIVVEIKAVSALAPEHHAQVINYLKVTGLEVGMLLNFGRTRLQIKRFVL